MASTAEPSASSGSTKRSSGAPLSDPDQPPEPENLREQSSTDCPGDRSALAVEVIWSIDAPCTVDLEALTNQLTQAREHLRTRGKNFAIALIDEVAMCALHAQHCDDPTPTDVLTFEVTTEPSTQAADIAICFDEAKRQAGLRGHTVESELLLYAIHGMLHCDGHTDTNPESFARMHAEEDRILTAIGIGPVFSPGTADQNQADRGADS